MANSNAPLGLCTCQWCGEDVAATGDGQFFCTAAHKDKFNNLRKERGALIYDLVMEWRYDRTVAGKVKTFARLCTVLSNFRREDREQRAGRRSWRPSRHVLERRPDLLNQTLIRRKD